MSQETITIIGSAVSLGILNISLYRMLDTRISHVETWPWRFARAHGSLGRIIRGIHSARKEGSMSKKKDIPEMADLPFDDVVSILLGSKPDPEEPTPSETSTVNLNT